ncbi:MAG TPA: hypothetical protein VFE31_14275 [Opitutaceae bacterium]|jgi:enamine deaminase RidA (YjgF/YER057c/UK114 family)|nr:hypothetical protein [Opitutaceae bacterium]
MPILDLKCQQPDFAAVFPRSVPDGEKAGYSMRRKGALLLGWRTGPLEGSLREAAQQLYTDLFAATEGLHLYRIWNQVPGINETPSATGLENYRSFSAGRAEAFGQRFGSDFSAMLPAASAVGTDAEELTVAFVAGPEAPRHCENPEQVPAYRYPPEHGPRPPSFARATSVAVEGTRYVFISGTAAIKGHHTVAPESLSRQIDCTLDNLRLVSTAAGAGPDLGRGAWRRMFRIYLRSASDRAAVEAALQAALLHPEDRVEWRHAALCRSALKVEIESTLVAE